MAGDGLNHVSMTLTEQLPILQVLVPFVAAPLIVFIGSRSLAWPIAFAGSIAPFAIASGPDCDRLASIAADPDHQATPVDYGGIDGARVIEVCGQAVSEFPDNGRYWVQLGRGYLKLDRGQAMLEAFEKARELQYPVAWFALAVVYHTGNGIPQADLSLAETLYQDAYRRGVGYAALGLARLYDEPESPFFDLEKSDVWQSRFDALFNRLG